MVDDTADKETYQTPSPPFLFFFSHREKTQTTPPASASENAFWRHCWLGGVTPLDALLNHPSILPFENKYIKPKKKKKKKERKKLGCQTSQHCKQQASGAGHRSEIRPRRRAHPSAAAAADRGLFAGRPARPECHRKGPAGTDPRKEWDVGVRPPPPLTDGRPGLGGPAPSAALFCRTLTRATR